jgi:hypothetical protein
VPDSLRALEADRSEFLQQFLALGRSSAWVHYRHHPTLRQAHLPLRQAQRPRTCATQNFEAADCLWAPVLWKPAARLLSAVASNNPECSGRSAAPMPSSLSAAAN